MRSAPVYRALADRILAMGNCERSGNHEWFTEHRAIAERIVADHLPRGSGIDTGPELDIEASSPNKIVLHLSYHHMNDGMYDGWTDHTITIRPSLALGFVLRVGGRDRRQIKEYLADTFDCALRETIEY